jgi:hypothetical protein
MIALIEPHDPKGKTGRPPFSILVMLQLTCRHPCIASPTVPLRDRAGRNPRRAQAGACARPLWGRGRLVAGAAVVLLSFVTADSLVTVLSGRMPLEDWQVLGLEYYVLEYPTFADPLDSTDPWQGFRVSPLVWRAESFSV